MAHSPTDRITLVLENARFGLSYIECQQRYVKMLIHRLQFDTTLPCRLPSVATMGRSETMF